MASNSPGAEEVVTWVKDAGVTAETAPRNVRYVRVSLEELDDLKSSNSTIELAMFGLSFGALLTIATTLATVTLPNDLTKTIFVVLVITFSLAALFFGASAVRAELKWRKRIKRLKGHALIE